ncbi:MAG TPA: HlyD family efflux transporter periplasmic adaptor subunit [Gemmatimonadales bacterium]|nr:HlyD family efflux transporter periplasmic adaptor subunit [Gemmatimonadales bacterium]
MPDSSAAFLDSEPPHWAARGLAWAIIGLFLLTLLASIIIQIPETVSGRFSLAPRSGADPVRARKDGIVTGILVHEGDTVPAGATIALLRSPSLSDRFGDQRTLQTQARADQERLRIASSQYDTRKRADEAEARRLRTRIESLTRLIGSKQRRLALTRELADSAQSGYRSGAVNRVESVRLDLEVTTLSEEVQNATSDLEDAQADLARLARDGQARDLEYQEIRRSLLESVETARIRIDALGRDLSDLTEAGLAVTAPCRGVVLRLHVSAAGAVVREGDIISEIACAGERLQAEFPVAQAGLPLIRPGQPVKLRYDAFPYQRYGVRFGTVRWVGPAGVSTSETGGFRVLVDLAEDSIRVRGQSRPLLAGMEGQADVVVGRRSLVSFAVEPVRAIRENLREPPR